MTGILTKNLNVIRKRWPDIHSQIQQANLNSLTVSVENMTLVINDIQLTSSYNRQAEAEIQVENIPQSSTQAFVYGTGLGDVALNLLQREQLKVLTICILNFDVFLHSLNAIDQVDWLSDSRINLTTAELLTDVLTPFIALPTELIFANDKSAKLRDRVMLELDHSFIMGHHNEGYSDAVSEVEANVSLIKVDDSVGELFNTINGRVYITAAGPTLAEHFQKLKNIALEDNSLIIALDASVKALLNEGIIPNFIVSIDARGGSLFDKLDIQNTLQKVPLIYFPRLEHKFLTLWPGKRYCSYSMGDLYNKYRKSYPKASLYTGGSVIHPAVDLTVKMGAKEVVLLGADFGFPTNKTHVGDMDSDYTNQFLSSSHWVMNGKGEKITTMLNYRGYLRDLERYIETKPQIKFFNGSANGALIEGAELLK